MLDWSFQVTGMGDTCCYDDSNVDGVPEGSLLWYISRGHKDDQRTIGGFSSVSATQEAITFSFYDQDGAVLYSTAGYAPRTLKR